MGDSMGGKATWSTDVVVTNKFDGMSEQEKNAEAAAMLSTDLSNKLLAGGGRRLSATDHILGLKSASHGDMTVATRMESYLFRALNQTILSWSSGTVQDVITALFGLTFHTAELDTESLLRIIDLLQELDHQLRGQSFSDETANQLLTILANVDVITKQTRTQPFINGNGSGLITELVDDYKMTIAQGVLGSRAAMEPAVWIQSTSQSLGHLKLSCEKLSKRTFPWTISAVDNAALFTLRGDSVPTLADSGNPADSEVVAFVSTERTLLEPSA